MNNRRGVSGDDEGKAEGTRPGFLSGNRGDFLFTVVPVPPIVYKFRFARNGYFRGNAEKDDSYSQRGATAADVMHR